VEETDAAVALFLATAFPAASSATVGTALHAAALRLANALPVDAGRLLPGAIPAGTKATIGATLLAVALGLADALALLALLVVVALSAYSVATVISAFPVVASRDTLYGTLPFVADRGYLRTGSALTSAAVVSTLSAVAKRHTWPVAGLRLPDAHQVRSPVNRKLRFIGPTITAGQHTRKDHQHQ